MDPNLFEFDLEKAGIILLALIFLSLIIERALALLFESRPFIDLTEDGNVLVKMKGIDKEKEPELYARYINRRKRKGLKEMVSLVVSVTVCWLIHFDAISIVFEHIGKTTIPGYILTGAVVAGGSKGIMKLFRDWLKISSLAEQQRQSIINPKEP